MVVQNNASHWSSFKRFAGLGFRIAFLLLCSFSLSGRNLDASSNFGDLENMWRTYLTEKGGGFPTLKQFEAFKNQKQMSGAPIFEPAAFLFLGEGFRELSDGRYDFARHNFLNAIELDPYLWPAYSGLARIKRAQDGDFLGYIYLNFKGMNAGLSAANIYFFLEVLSWFFLVVLQALAAAFIVYTLYLCLVYGRPFYTTMFNLFEEKGLKDFAAHMFSVLITLAPLILGLNLLLSAAVYLALFFPHFKPRQKLGVMVVLATLIVMTPLLKLFNSNILYTRGSSEFYLKQTQYFGADTKERLQMLTTVEAQTDRDDHLRLIKANLQRLAGKLDASLTTLDSIPASSDYYPFVLVNKGNIFFWAEEYSKAIATYRSAFEKDPTLGIALYNMSVVEGVLENHQEAESLRSRANAVDARLSREHGFLGGVGGNVVLIAQPKPKGNLWHALFNGANPDTDGWYAGPSFMGVTILFLLVLVAALTHDRFRNPAQLALSCFKCGRAYFIKDSPNSSQCSQCINYFQKMVDLPSESKLKKEQEVKRYALFRRWFGIVSSALLPGSRGLVGGNAALAWVIVLGWVCLWTMIFVTPSLSMPYRSYFFEDRMLPYALYGVTALYWAVFGLLPLRREE